MFGTSINEGQSSKSAPFSKTISSVEIESPSTSIVKETAQVWSIQLIFIGMVITPSEPEYSSSSLSSTMLARTVVTEPSSSNQVISLGTFPGTPNPS